MHIMYNLYVNSHFKITLSKDQYTVKAQEHLFPTWLCCHVTVCPCTNGGHHGGCHLASVTRCKILKAVVKPFIHVQLTRAGLACRKGSLKCKQAMALQLGHSLLAAWPGIPKLHLFIAAFLPFLSSFPQWHSTISRFISQCLHQSRTSRSALINTTGADIIPVFTVTTQVTWPSCLNVSSHRIWPAFAAGLCS